MLEKAELAKRIKKAIEDSPLSQADVAVAFGVTEQAVSSWCREGKIDKRKLPRLAALTSVPLSRFLPDETPANQPAAAGIAPAATGIDEVARARVKVLERAVEDLVHLLTMNLVHLTATTPAAGQAVAEELRVYLSEEPGAQSEVLPPVMKRLEAALRLPSPVVRRKKPLRSK